MHWTGLSPDEARAFLAQKDKSKRDKRMTLSEAVKAFIKDGDNLGIGGFVNSRQPIAIIHEIIRQGRKDLTLSFQSAGLGPDLLAGAMALHRNLLSIKRLEFAYFAYEYAGLSSIFRYLAENGLIKIEDWSNFNMSARFKAGSMGVPFLPMRSPLGSDVMQGNRSMTIDCPYTGRKIGLVPASHPNVALIHVQEADIYGNCRIKGQTLIEVPFGAYPGMCYDYYYFGLEHIRRFKQLAESFRKGDTKGFSDYYDRYILGVEDFDGFLGQITYQELKHSQQMVLLLRKCLSSPALTSWKTVK